MPGNAQGRWRQGAAPRESGQHGPDAPTTIQSPRFPPAAASVPSSAPGRGGPGFPVLPLLCGSARSASPPSLLLHMVSPLLLFLLLLFSPPPCCLRDSPRSMLRPEPPGECFPAVARTGHVSRLGLARPGCAWGSAGQHAAQWGEGGQQRKKEAVGSGASQNSRPEFSGCAGEEPEEVHSPSLSPFLFSFCLPPSPSHPPFQE